MLDIKEVERRLKDDIKVELECVDALAFTKSHNDANREILDSGLLVELVDQGSIYIRGSDYNIIKSEYKYFRIKEDSPYIEGKTTFDDLIDVAVKAVRDGELHKFTFNKCLSNKDIIWLYTYKDESKHFMHDQAQCGIDFINSLYTETFVIDDIDDLRRIEIGADGELSNGSKFEVDSVSTIGLDWINVRFIESKSLSPETLGIEVLKGATVTQKRGK